MKHPAGDYLILDESTGTWKEDPEQAVRDELAGVEEAIRRQEVAAKRREEARAAVAARPSPTPHLPPPPSTPSFVGDPPPELFDDPPGASAPPPASGAVAAGAAGAAEAAPPSSGPAPDAFDVAWCEFLLNHAGEDTAMLRRLSRVVPATLFCNALVRSIVEAFYAIPGAASDPVADLQNRDPSAADFIGRIAARRDRAGTMENWQERDLERDLILGAWRRHLQERLEAAASDPGPDAMRRRLAARAGIRALRSWETGEATVLDLAGLPSDASLSSAAPVAVPSVAPVAVSSAAPSAVPVPPAFPTSPPSSNPPPSDFELPPDDF